MSPAKGETVSESVEALGREVVELFTACGGAPDDPAVARAAGEAMDRLEAALAAAEPDDPEPGRTIP